MILKTALLTLFLSILAAAAPATADSVKGEWSGVFVIAGHTADVSLNFDVKGSVLTGTVNSEHTGPGTVTDGKWENGKLSCTLTFSKHESIKFWGTFADGKLSGEFATEGMTGTWTATRK